MTANIAASIYEAKRFRKQIEKTISKRSIQSRAPGVLEHRVSPRLEWLVDFGCLSKEGLQKNGFTYRIEPGARLLLNDLDKFVDVPHWAECVAISQWLGNSIWDELRAKCRSNNLESTFLKAYRLLRKPIGPSPLHDVAFVSALFVASASGYPEIESAIIDFAQKTEGVTLSGGRVQRRPENIYMSDKLLA